MDKTIDWPALVLRLNPRGVIGMLARRASLLDYEARENHLHLFVPRGTDRADWGGLRDALEAEFGAGLRLSIYEDVTEDVLSIGEKRLLDLPAGPEIH